MDAALKGESRRRRARGLLLLAASFAMGCGARPAAPPNIVMIVADDQDWRDFGFMGSSRASTPRLDALAAEGIVYSQGFNTASSCRPSLRSLLTGLDPIQVDTVVDYLRERQVPMPELVAVGAFQTLPALLAEAGYASFQGGKFWEGSFESRGFSDGLARGLTPEGVEEFGLIHEAAGGKSALLGREAMTPLFDFMRANREQPFFVFFTPMLPHYPHDPAPEHLRSYPADRFRPAERGYYGNITRLDAVVGELLDQLAALGLRERTLVIFLSDNGWQPPREGAPALGVIGDRAGKLSMQEDGFRTPIVLSLPGVIAAGTRDDRLVSSVDLFPTVLDFAGVEAPRSLRPGISLHPHLTGQGATPREQVIGGMSQLRDDLLLEPAPDVAQARHETAWFRRDRRWRYVWFPDRGYEALYEIELDPREQHDLAASRPEEARRQRALTLRWIEQQRAPIRAWLQRRAEQLSGARAE